MLGTAVAILNRSLLIRSSYTQNAIRQSAVHLIRSDKSQCVSLFKAPGAFV